jgi:hypothetical protein
MDQNDEWQLQHRYLSLEPLADLHPDATNETQPLDAAAVTPQNPPARPRQLHHQAN